MSATVRLLIDLPAQTAKPSAVRRLAFDLDPDRKRDLIDRIEEVEQSLADETSIRRFESDRTVSQQWFPP